MFELTSEHRDELIRLLTASREVPGEVRLPRDGVNLLLDEINRLRRVEWQAQSLANDWHMKGEYDMNNAKTLPDSDISALVLAAGADMVEYARELRQALEAANV